ncbi:MAG: hypothetical protein ACMUEM_06925 [Flavobacteriales bacterium AspAUS03]
MMRISRFFLASWISFIVPMVMGIIFFFLRTKCIDVRMNHEYVFPGFQTTLVGPVVQFLYYDLDLGSTLRSELLFSDAAEESLSFFC